VDAVIALVINAWMLIVRERQAERSKRISLMGPAAAAAGFAQRTQGNVFSGSYSVDLP